MTTKEERLRWFRVIVDSLPEPPHGCLAGGPVARPDNPKAAPLDDVGIDSDDMQKNEVK